MLIVGIALGATLATLNDRRQVRLYLAALERQDFDEAERRVRFWFFGTPAWFRNLRPDDGEAEEDDQGD